MSGKLFTYRAARVARAPASAAMLLAALGATNAGCRGPRALTRPAAAVEGSVRPERFATAFSKVGRAHFRGVARFEAGLGAGSMESVTTETDIWIDDQGNWRLVELNDKDGGREIVLHGRELAVALRYGKMIRRPAEDPEPRRLLEEGLGGPFAAWDLLREVTTVDDFGTENRNGRKVHIYKMTKAGRPRAPAATVDPNDRQSWRRTVVAGMVDGTVVVDDATGLPLQAEFRAKYTMRRPTDASVAGTPMQGAVDVRVSVEDIGRSPPIARPEAEDLALRQRTVPEEKALLGGLPRSAAPPPSPAPSGGKP